MHRQRGSISESRAACAGSRPARPACVRARLGTTLVDVLLATTVFTLVLASVASTLMATARARETRDTAARLHEQGAEALRTIVADLRRSGRVVIDGTRYPLLLTDGLTDGVTLDAARGDEDLGPNRAIVFVLPADDDANGTPDVEAGRLVWSETEVSYVVVTDAGGVNVLQRREDARSRRRVVSDVERVVFDDFESSGFAVPLGSIRIRIFLRASDPTGIVHRVSVSATVRLRNGALGGPDEAMKRETMKR